MQKVEANRGVVSSQTPLCIIQCWVTTRCDRETSVGLFLALDMHKPFYHLLLIFQIGSNQGIPNSWISLCVMEEKLTQSTPSKETYNLRKIHQLVGYLFIIGCLRPTLVRGFRLCQSDAFWKKFYSSFHIICLLPQLYSPVLKVLSFSILAICLKDSLHCFWNELEPKQNP